MGETVESATRLRPEDPFESTDLTLSGLKRIPGEPSRLRARLPELLPELRAVSSLVSSPSRFFFS